MNRPTPDPRAKLSFGFRIDRAARRKAEREMRSVVMTGAQKKLIKQMENEKPHQGTVVKRSTAGNLAYLAKKKSLGHGPSAEESAAEANSRLLVPRSSRKRGEDGTFSQDHTPTNGV